MENHTVSGVWGEMLEDPTGRDRRGAGSPWIVHDVRNIERLKILCIESGKASMKP